MKNVATGAPPPGFAAFMKAKAEKAEAEKHKLKAEKMAKLKEM